MSRAVKGSSHAGKGKSRKKSTEIRERILQTPNSSKWISFTFDLVTCLEKMCVCRN